MLIVQGEYEACLAAIREIIPTMKDNQRVLSDQYEIRLLTHQSQAGAVIGREWTCLDVRDRETNVVYFLLR